MGCVGTRVGTGNRDRASGTTGARTATHCSATRGVDDRHCHRVVYAGNCHIATGTRRAVWRVVLCPGGVDIAAQSNRARSQDVHRTRGSTAVECSCGHNRPRTRAGNTVAGKQVNQSSRRDDGRVHVDVRGRVKMYRSICADNRFRNRY